MRLYEFKDIEIFEINGHSKIRFEGVFTSSELVSELIERWIPYYECHRCGKGDYCKYAVPYSGNIDKKKDIKCGVAKDAIKNYVLRTIHVLNKSDKQKQQKYIDSVFYFYRYIYFSEQLNGVFIDKSKLDYWGEHFIYFLTEILSLRDILNNLGRNIKDLKELYIGQSLLLVEGETEYKFIESLRGDDTFSMPAYFVVECYKGKGNRIPKRIRMLLDDYHTKGYSIYIQGDEDGNGDGSGYDKFKSYVDDGIIPKENIFQFKYDFETSIPRELLFLILREYSYLEDKSFEDIKNLPSNVSINTTLKKLV